jgi:hypothetical protein
MAFRLSFWTIPFLRVQYNMPHGAIYPGATNHGPALSMVI